SGWPSLVDYLGRLVEDGGPAVGNVEDDDEVAPPLAARSATARSTAGARATCSLDFETMPSAPTLLPMALSCSMSQPETRTIPRLDSCELSRSSLANLSPLMVGMLMSSATTVIPSRLITDVAPMGVASSETSKPALTRTVRI